MSRGVTSSDFQRKRGIRGVEGGRKVKIGRRRKWLLQYLGERQGRLSLEVAPEVEKCIHRTPLFTPWEPLESRDCVLTILCPSFFIQTS